MAKAIPKNVINPFSDAFIETWQLWKDYKWESHKWQYKGVISEQVALKQLVDLSEGDEQKAQKIIYQSIRRGWQGLFPLHETTSPNGKSSTKKQPASKTGNGAAATKEERISDVQSEITKRYSRGQAGDGESHLKAV